MKKFYAHNCHNGHTMEIAEGLANRIINSSAWFVNQCGQDYDAESPNGTLFCIMVREAPTDFGGQGFDWTEYSTWM